MRENSETKRGIAMGETKEGYKRNCTCGEWSSPEIVNHRKDGPCFLIERKRDEMSEIDDGGPAFPTDGESQVSARLWHFSGLTKREYSAINLRVPNSGTEWLDEMIRASLHNEFAGMALQGALSRGVEGVEVERIASDSFLMADAMVQAGKGEK